MLGTYIRYCVKIKPEVSKLLSIDRFSIEWWQLDKRSLRNSIDIRHRRLYCRKQPDYNILDYNTDSFCIDCSRGICKRCCTDIGGGKNPDRSDCIGRIDSGIRCILDSIPNSILDNRCTDRTDREFVRRSTSWDTVRFHKRWTDTNRNYCNPSPAGIDRCRQ